MEEERNSLKEDVGSPNSTASTPKADNHGEDTENGWSSDDGYNSQDDTSNNDADPNKTTTESGLQLGDDNFMNIENDSDA